MNTSNNNHLNLLDLPNEILLIIINKLNIVDVFYSLVDVSERFAQLVLDPLYIRNLDMTVMTMKSVFDRTFSPDEQVLNRICENILPQIYDQVNKLTVEQDSMERILLSVYYPQLYSLSLVNFQEEILFQYLTGDSRFRYLLTEQITHLNIDIWNETTSQLSEISSNIFALILCLSKRLTNLNFSHLFYDRLCAICIYKLPTTTCRSSSLTKLKISVAFFDDCLYILDGRFDCLSTLIINVKRILYKKSNIDNSKKLPKLKCFSLTSFDLAIHYDDQIIPLLRRMINLEELILFLPVTRYDSTYIDGVQLHDEILTYMPRLNKFTFNIYTAVMMKNIKKIDLPSNEDFHRSFIGKGYGQVGSDVDTKPMYILGKSHVYSLPYQFENFLHLMSSFQGGMFDKVRRLTMTDSRPFKYELFKLVSQDFPFLKELCICNVHPQNDKQHSSTLIIFPHLILLNLVIAHVDYVEQFLYDKNIYLPCLMDVCIEYESLAMITNNFTDDATRLNCAKLKRFHMKKPFVRAKNFHQYFPFL